MSRKRGAVVVRGKSVSVLLDLGLQPRRKCPTTRCRGSVFTDRRAMMACERCGAPLDPPAPYRKRVWHSGYKNKTEAGKALTKMLGQADGGTFVKPSSLTVRMFIEDTWMPGLRAGKLRPSTVAMYELSVRTCILPHLGGLRLREVTPVRLKT